ncbi:MAG: alpha-L-fucosidase [Candidatus Helarchaeota archaeon]|nr:alpha-L-fucosidase [Candidatus Helarchaeota archaeon]
MSNKNDKDWWEKPGLAIMYQIEARPGWIWNRNYDKFNASMRDKDGNFKFNGPFCKMKEWVEFSKRVGVDYHIFEAKWHDGICYWDTKYTDWKTPEDYVKVLSEESEKAGIPLMYYYSSIFDHNPQFDDIQPLRSCTPSFIAMHHKNKEIIAKESYETAKFVKTMFEISSKRNNIPYKQEFFDDVNFNEFTYNPLKYEIYMLKQLVELIENHKTAGLWMDWYHFPNMKERSSHIVMYFMEKKYPEIILTFNQSIDYKLKYAHYLSGEAHDTKTAWQQGNRYRKLKKPWELVGPAAKAWDAPLTRSDPYEIFRMAAIVMANGGKFGFGMAAQMNGELYPEPAQQLEHLGKWYKPRRLLFTEAVPMNYKGKKVPGIELNKKDFGTIGSIYGNDNLIHIINFNGHKEELTLTFSQELWGNIEKIILEPDLKELRFKKQENEIILSLSKEDIDRTDTIIRICEGK